jgi:hypothetical protein
MFTFVRGAASDLWCFEFGPSSEPPRGLEPFLAWLLEDYDGRREEQWRAPRSKVVDVLARWLPRAQTQRELVDELTLLGLYFDERAAPIVAPYLDHADPAVRAAAVRALGRAAVFSSVDSIGKRTADPDPEVRRQAVLALGNVEHARGLRYLDAAVARDPALAPPAEHARALIVAGERADIVTTAKLALASDEFEDATRHAMYYLESIPLLVEDATQPDLVRARAIRALGVTGHRRTARHVGPIVSDDAAPLAVRLAAIRALGRLGTAAATGRLLPLLDAEPEELEAAAIEAIGRVRDERHMETLLARWDRRGGALRDGIRTALRRMSEPGEDLASRPAWTLPADRVSFVHITGDLAFYRGARLDLVRPLLRAEGPLARRDAAIFVAYFGDSTDKGRLEAVYRGDPVEELRWIGAIGVREMERRGL